MAYRDITTTPGRESSPERIGASSLSPLKRGQQAAGIRAPRCSALSWQAEIGIVSRLAFAAGAF
jgi:hypothetical protein